MTCSASRESTKKNATILSMPITYVKKRNNTQNDMGTLFSSNRKNEVGPNKLKRKRCYTLCDETDNGQLHTCRKVCEMEMVAEPVAEAACTRGAIASMPEHVVTGRDTQMVLVDGTHATTLLPTGCMVNPHNEILYNLSDNQDSKFAGLAGVVGRVCQRGGEHWIADYGMGCDSPTARAHWQMDEPMCEKYTRELYPNSKYSLAYSPPDNVSGCVYDPVTNIATYRKNALDSFDERGLHTSGWQRICIASDGKPFSTEPGAYCPGEEDVHGRLKLYSDTRREKEETAKAASVDPPIHNETTIPATSVSAKKQKITA